MSPPPQDFRLWLREAHDGSREALGKALESCRRYLLDVARRELDLRLQAKGGASDLVQETFLDAQRLFDQFHGDSEPELRGWLRRLLHYRAAKFGRHFRATQKRRHSLESPPNGAGRDTAWEGGLPAAGPSPSTLVMAHEQAQRLRQALERLPDDYRRVITLRYVEQCSFDEIGRLMQRTPNAARLLWLRAVERVKLELGGRDEP